VTVINMIFFNITELLSKTQSQSHLLKLQKISRLRRYFAKRDI
jgi:hypothetical protein